MSKLNSFGISRRRVLEGAAATLAAHVAPSLASQQEWPSSQTIKFITQGGAGDAMDQRIRAFVEDLGPYLNNATRIVENKPGAAGIIAALATLNAPADGNTVFVSNVQMATLPSFNRQLPFVPLRDFTPIAYSGIAPTCFAIPASRPETTFAEWLASAKARAGKLNFASTGNGALSHLYGHQLSQDFGLKAVHIAYKGLTPGLLAMGAGQIDYLMAAPSDLRAFVTNGRVRILALTGESRSPMLPEIPTFKELGHPNFERTGWSMYFMRSNTPAPIVAKMAAAITQVSKTPKWAQLRAEILTDWREASIQELRAHLEADTKKWAEVMKKSGISGA